MDDTIRHVLTAYRTCAVVRAAPDPFRDSADDAGPRERLGKHVAGVNPNGDEAYALLETAAADHDIEVLASSTAQRGAPPCRHEAVAIRAKAVWP